LSTSSLGSDENRHHADVSTMNGASPFLVPSGCCADEVGQRMWFRSQGSRTYPVADILPGLELWPWLAGLCPVSRPEEEKKEEAKKAVASYETANAKRCRFGEELSVTNAPPGSMLLIRNAVVRMPPYLSIAMYN
jgi:hypothetical protein